MDEVDAVGVDAVLVAIDALTGAGIGRELKEATEVAGDGVYVLVNDSEPDITVFTQCVAEEGVGRREGVTEDEDVVGTEKHLTGAVPGVDVMARDDGLEPQLREERGNGQGPMLWVETEFEGQTLAEERREVEAVQRTDGEVVLVLHIHILGEGAMEMDGRRGTAAGKGGVVEREQLAVLAAELGVEAREVFV